jgi:Family of unknown function (DUF5766)
MMASLPSFTYKIDCDDFDDEDNSVVSFVATAGNGFKTTITLFDLDAGGTGPWQKLYDANPETKIVMCESNGEVTIRVNSNSILFDVSKHGAGGDGSITVEVPADIGLPVLRSCYEAWTERQKQFE